MARSIIDLWRIPGGAPAARANRALLYSYDVAASAEGFAQDEAGNETQLTSHNFQLFTPDLALVYPWSFYAKNNYLGIEIAANIAQALKDLEGLTGKTYLHVNNFTKTSWTDEQARIKAAEDNKKYADNLGL